MNRITSGLTIVFLFLFSVSLLAWPMVEDPNIEKDSVISRTTIENEQASRAQSSDPNAAQNQTPVIISRAASAIEPDIAVVTTQSLGLDLSKIEEMPFVNKATIEAWVIAKAKGDTIKERENFNIALEAMVSALSVWSPSISKEKLCNESLRNSVLAKLELRAQQARGEVLSTSELLRQEEEQQAAEKFTAASASSSSVVSDSVSASSSSAAPAPVGLRPTSTAELLNKLQNSSLAAFVPNFLVSDPATQKKEAQEKYKDAYNDTRTFSPEFNNIIDAVLSQRRFFETEEEAKEFFNTTLAEALQLKASEADLKEFILRASRIQGLDAALEVLDAATEHRNRFLNALANNRDPQRSLFYHQQIGNIDKTVQNLQRAATSILQTTESIIRAERWRESLEAVDVNLIDANLVQAKYHAEESLRLNTEYAKAIIAEDPQAARDLAQEALRHSQQAELLYSITKYQIHAAKETRAHNNYRASIWARVATLSYKALRAIEAHSQPVADLYIEAATYHKHHAEVNIHNDFSGYAWEDAGRACSAAAEATAVGNQVVAELYTQAATYYKNTVEASIANNEPLEFEYYRVGQACFSAAEATAAGNQVVAELYTQTATYYKNAAEATIANNEPLKKLFENAGSACLAAANTRAIGNEFLAELYMRAATQYKYAAEATIANDEPRVKRCTIAAERSYKYARDYIT